MLYSLGAVSVYSVQEESSWDGIAERYCSAADVEEVASSPTADESSCGEAAS